MKEYVRGRQATDDSMIRHMRIACWTPKATNTHSEYVMLIAFPLQQGFLNALRCYMIRMLPLV